MRCGDEVYGDTCSYWRVAGEQVMQIKEEECNAEGNLASHRVVSPCLVVGESHLIRMCE